MFRKLLNFFRPGRLETDLHEEIEFHLSQTNGTFGNGTLTADRMRDASTIAWLETWAQDIRYGIRQLRRSPVLVVVAVLSLALGIGANTAIFTLINAIMLQMLPVRDPASLVLLYNEIATGVTSGDLIGDAVSYPFYQDLRTHNKSFQALCAFRQGNDDATMHVSGEPETRVEHASVHLVSGNYFHMLGVSAAAGRVFREADDTRSSSPLVVMSYRWWKDRFNLDPAAIGKTVVLNGTQLTIAGVADAQFFGERIGKAPDFWIPLSFEPQIFKREPLLDSMNEYWLNFMGRLRPGVDSQIASAEVTAKLHAFYLAQAGAHPTKDARNKIERVQITLKPGGAGISGLRYLYSKPLRVLMAVVGLVLLIACANLATLLLARATARRKEFLCRLALGAGRARLIRQVLTESVLLSLVGGVAGSLFAWWSVKALRLLLHFDSVVKVQPDPAVLAFTLLLSVATGILFGIIPAWKFSRLDLRPGSGTGASWRGHRFGSTQMLIALQVAMSLCLLVAAGLLARSLAELERQNVGFARDRVLLVRTDAELAGYQLSQYKELYRELGDRISALPGVQSATLAHFSPVSGYSSSGTIAIEGQHPKNGMNVDAWFLEVGSRFFTTMKIPLLLGRTISARDTATSTPVVVVNQTFVDRYLKNVNPIGQRIQHGSKTQPMEVVGVVADSKFYDLREKANPMMFYPISQHPVADFELILRTAANPNGVSAEVRDALKQLNARLPILQQTTLNEQLEFSLRQQKMITSLCSIFGILALLLASVGIYGTLAYSVAGRTSEIGIRMAIGAQRTDVLLLMLRDLALVLLVGFVSGLPFALGASRWLQSFLFEVKPLDPLALGGSVLLIGGSAVLAGYLPAQRATRIQPMLALKHE